jgi:PhzF family phenazine biosynthesis protein
VVLESQRDVERLKPNFQSLKTVDARGVIVTAPGDANGVDFVSRAFFPKLGVEEDPVTGSAHCALVPYWSKRLGKTQLRAQQISARLGELHCEITADARVIIAGQAQLYLEGSYYLPTMSKTA